MIKYYTIKGPTRLLGEVQISGSKNASLPIMSATLLTDKEVVLNNIPKLRDIKTMVALLETLGKKIQVEKNRLIIRSSQKKNHQAAYELVKKMRASIVVLGPLVAKYKKALVSLPGGCAFGPRPVDLHLKGITALGAKVNLEHGYISAEAKNGLVGKEIKLSGKHGSSVLATDNVAMAACLALGRSVIRDAAKEPETIDMLNFLNHIGAKIKGIGSSKISIEGVSSLDGGEYTIIDDRIEAGTFMIYAALSKSNVLIRYKHMEHLKSLINLLKSIGVNFKIEEQGIRIKGKDPKHYEPFNIKTNSYPDFPTDLQSILMVLGTLISKECSIKEQVYPNRFNHASEMVRMGADVMINEGGIAYMNKPSKLQGADIQCSDLRAGAALVGAALVASGTTTLRRVYHIERGYESLDQKLSKLGASIKTGLDSIL